jgi:hypothetical protein
MRFLLAFWLLIAAVAGTAAAQDRAFGLTSKDAAAIKDVIQRQIAAFGRDDAAGAFALATPGIRRTFGSAETFVAMVQSGYMAVYRPREVEFRALLTDGGRFVQTVLVVGPDGVAQLAHYPMQRQADGSWLIDGCWLAPAPDAST